MEGREVLQQLGEPVEASITGHQVVSMGGQSVAWYTIRARWRHGDAVTEKKQRFSIMQEALLNVRDLNERYALGASLPMLPLSVLRGTSEATCVQRAKEFSAFLAAALQHARLRRVPELLQLLAPDDTTLATAPTAGPREATSSSNQACAAARAPNDDGAGGAGSATARPATAGQAPASETVVSTGGAAAGARPPGVPPPPVARYPHRTNEVVAVAPAEEVQRLQRLFEQCREAVQQLRQACTERDDALRAKDVTIARLAGQLAELQAE